MGRPRQFDDPKRMAIVLPQSLYAWLCAQAKAQGTKPSTLARSLIEQACHADLADSITRKPAPAATKPPRSPRDRRGRS